MGNLSNILDYIKKNKNIWLFRIGFLFAGSLLMLTTLEYISRASMIEYFSWIVANFWHFLFSLIFAFLFLSFLWALINRFYAAFILSFLIYLTVCVISFYKFAHLGSPFIPSDVLLFNPAFASLLPDLHISYIDLFKLWWIYPLFIIYIVIGNLAVFSDKELRLKKIERIAACATAFILLVVLSIIPKAAGLNQKSYHLYQKNGVTLGFIQSAKSLGSFSVRVIEYDEQDIRHKIAKFDEQASTPNTPETMPNVIVVLSESFWDVTQLPNIELSHDPIPCFRELSKNYTSGQIISPTYGGVTSNVEFELLTGFTTKYFPFETNVYTTFIKGKTPTLASYFKSFGYLCTGIHTYNSDFFERNRIYPDFGFDVFLGAEDFVNPEIKGSFISDKELAKAIIKQYESSDSKHFIFAISMQNHMPYCLPDYYPDNKFKVSSNLLSQDELYRLQTFCQGINDADASLKMLVDYFSKVKEPTVILFFGDHLPALDENAGIYKKLGFVKDPSLIFNSTDNSDQDLLSDYRKLLTTSYVIWSNYQLEKQTPPQMSVNFLGTYLMDYLGLKKPQFNCFLFELYKETPVIGHFLTIDKNGSQHSSMPSHLNDYNSLYETIQNDIIFGNKKLWNLFEAK